MLVQSKVKRGRETTEVAESRTAGGAVSTKEEAVMDKAGPDASPILSEKARTPMKKLVEAILTVCSIYDLDFRKLIREHKLGVVEDLVGKASFV